jgi:hypothetical protein
MMLLVDETTRNALTVESSSRAFLLEQVSYL